MRFLLAMATLLLAGCAGQGGGAGGGKPVAWNGDKTVANDANPFCQVADQGLMHVRPGDNVPLSMTVTNSGRWCFSGFGFSGVNAAGSTVYAQPANGEVRLLMQPNAVVFGYRPKPGFAGGDRFSVLMQSGIYGIESHIVVSVAVKPL